MFLERRASIYDYEKRYIDIKSLLANAPGWKIISEWEDVGNYIRCNVGWMAMHNNFYIALIGSSILADDEPLYIQNLGINAITGEESPVIEIPIWVGPLPTTTLSCVIL